MTHRPFIHRLFLTTALGATLLTHPLALGEGVDIAPNPTVTSAETPATTPAGTSSGPRTSKAFNQEKNDDFVYVAGRGNLTEVQKFLSKGMPVDAINQSDETALMRASQYGKNDIVTLLLDKGAKIDLRAQHGLTALMMASRYGKKDIVHLLLNRRAKIDLQDEDGETALIMASSEGHKDTVAVLIDKGANRDLKNKSGQTALDIARAKGYTEIVALLDVPNPEKEQKIWEARVKIITDGGFLEDPTKAGMSAADLAEFKDAATCPITHEIMRDPVRTPTGKHAYERSAISEWLIKNGTDPRDRSQQTIDNYKPDKELAQKIKDFMDKHAPVSEKQ